jgi:hypothetical protein
MIVKIKGRKTPTYQQLLNYIARDKDRLVDKQGQSFLLLHNVRGGGIDEWVKQFNVNEGFRLHKRRDNILLYHEIVSFHKADKVSLEILEDMAKEYIRLRNPNGMYVAVPHYDKSHLHLHFCVSGLEYRTIKSMRLSKTALRELKIKFQEYQLKKYPELSKSVVWHGKGKAVSEKEFQLKLRTGRESQKDKLSAILKTCYKKARSPESFYELLKGLEAIPYLRGGKISGVVFGGRKFRLKRLGFSEERILELDREKSLEKLRKKRKNINRNR